MIEKERGLLVMYNKGGTRILFHGPNVYLYSDRHLVSHLTLQVHVSIPVLLVKFLKFLLILFFLPDWVSNPHVHLFSTTVLYGTETLKRHKEKETYDITGVRDK